MTESIKYGNKWVMWYIPFNPTLKRWRQEDQVFKASLGYILSLRAVWAP